MKAGKLSPLVVTLMVLLVGALAGMTYMIGTEQLLALDGTGLMLAGASMALMWTIAVLMVRDARAQLAEQATQNGRNQAAILQLLDEISDLAEGDLSIRASVTENFTGAIADSINFAIDQMRGLVFNINDLSRQVAAAAENTQSTASKLADAAEGQAKEIGAASHAIKELLAAAQTLWRTSGCRGGGRSRLSRATHMTS